ncbi:MAG: hypothetical protein M1812_002322 [Candelaria pacifica]|nr:MAG: hypothetical protein M1812_002322 [Candelaria pacifica]
MPPQKRGRAGYSGSRGGTRGRGNSASNGGTTDDENQRRRNNRTVRFEETSSNSLTNGSGAPPRPNRNQQFQRNTNRGARSTDQQTNGIAEATSEEGWRDPGTISPDAYKNKMSDHHQKLKQRRVKERAAAIANGLMSDPEKPTKLADAITLVGTCRDMCAEHERVERVVANEVDDCEKIRLDSSSGSPGRRVPFEEHMVKRFNRSSAGKEEELPSDVRPPLILQKTVDYLFNELLESNRAFPSVQDFIWNRTRAIRVDFSIQHISKLPDLRIAIDCLERIARFHIVSLHQRSLIIEANEHFSHKQEADQLKNTLLSLSYYYNDSRHRLQSPNEAEFRAYSIIYFLQNNETEQEAQNWPKNTLWAPRVQQALKLYAAAGNTMDSHGPLVPNTSQSIAQGNYGRFWKMVGSKEISYLMACTAEIHFNRIRKAALTSIWKSRYRPKPTEDWELNDLIPVLGFDSTEQVRSYCEAHGFRVAKGAKGISYVDFTSVSDRISDPSPPLKQTFSARLVESKRYDRTLTAIINGIPASTARDEGMTEDLNAENSQHSSKQQPESLFVQDDSEEELPSLADLKPTSIGVTSETDSTKPNPFANPFAPAIKRNPFVKDDGLDTLTDAKPTAPSNPFNNTQPSQLGSQSPSSNTFGVQPFASAFSSASTPPTSPFALTSTVSVPPRSTFGLPSGPTVAPETSSNLTFTSVFHLGPAKSESKNENTTTSADKPSESTTSIFQPPNSQALSEKPSTTQKPNPFLPTSNSSSIFGDPSSRTNAVAVAPQQPPNPFFPTADSPSIFGPASLSAKPVTAVPQQPSSLFPSNTNQPSIFGAPSSGKISTTAAPEQPASSIFPSKIDSPAILGAPSSSTKPTATTAQQPPNLFFPSSQPPSSSALQPSDNTFSFLNATPTTKPTSSALQPSDDTFSFLNASPGTKPTFSASQPSQTNPSSSNSAKSPKSNPFPATFIPPKDASTSPQFSFPKAGESPSTDQAKAPAPSQNQAAQQPPSAQGLFQNNTAKPQQSLTSAVDLLGSSNAAKNPPAQQAALHFPPTSQPANSATFEQLSKSVFLEQKGLLEQLIEYTASPIILDAMHQVEDEKLQKKKGL